MDYNPLIYTAPELLLMDEKQILVAQYQLQLASISLFFAIAILVTIFLILKWFLPKFWYKSREVE